MKKEEVKQKKQQCFTRVHCTFSQMLAGKTETK